MIAVSTDNQSLKNTIKILTGMVDSHITPMVNREAAQALLDAIRENARSRLTKDPTGALERSFYVEGDPSDELWVASALPYARIHDTGGTIRPKRGKYLAIPLNKAQRGIWPRDYSGKLFFFVSRRGSKLLAERRGSTIDPKYLLKTHVQIQPTNYVRDAIKTSPTEAQRRIASRLAGMRLKA